MTSAGTERGRLLSHALARGFEPGPLRTAYFISIGSVCFLFPFGLVFVAGGLLPQGFSWTATVIILLVSLSALFSEMREGNVRSAALRFSLLATTLFGVEWLGVHTGLPFGTYRYTRALGILVCGVPIAIPFAWYATVVNSRHIAGSILGDGRSRSRAGTALLAGGLTVALDLLLEPTASLVQNYWLWDGAAVPIQNYLSWFLFSAAAVWWLEGFTPAAAGERGARLTATMLMTTQAALFLLTDLIHGHVIPPLIAGAVVLFGTVLINLVRPRAMSAP